MSEAVRRINGVGYVGIGQVVFAEAPERLTAVLASCVAVVVYDPEAKKGGLAHVLMAGEGEGSNFRYSDPAVQHLIEQMREEADAGVRLVAKVVGGARNVMADESSLVGSIGRNAVIRIVTILLEEGIDIEGMHIGGTIERNVLFDAETGEVIISLNGGAGRSTMLVI